MLTWGWEDVALLGTCVVGVPIILLVVCIHLFLRLEETVGLIYIDGVAWHSYQAVGIQTSVWHILVVGQFLHFRASICQVEAYVVSYLSYLVAPVDGKLPTTCFKLSVVYLWGGSSEHLWILYADEHACVVLDEVVERTAQPIVEQGKVETEVMAVDSLPATL